MARNRKWQSGEEGIRGEVCRFAARDITTKNAPVEMAEVRDRITGKTVKVRLDTVTTVLRALRALAN